MIKMLTSTYFNGKDYKENEMYPLDAEIESRWIKNKIAEAVIPLTSNNSDKKGAVKAEKEKEDEE